MRILHYSLPVLRREGLLKTAVDNIPVTLDGIGAHLVHDSLHLSNKLLSVSHRPSLTIASHLSSIPGALAQPNKNNNVHSQLVTQLCLAIMNSRVFC